MKKDLPKFLFATNEAARPNERFVVHTNSPSFVARVQHFSNSKEAEAYISFLQPSQYFYKASATFLVEIIVFFEKDPDLTRIDWFLKRTANWYQHTNFSSEHSE